LLEGSGRALRGLGQPWIWMWLSRLLTAWVVPVPTPPLTVLLRGWAAPTCSSIRRPGITSGSSGLLLNTSQKLYLGLISVLLNLFPCGLGQLGSSERRRVADVCRWRMACGPVSFLLLPDQRQLVIRRLLSCQAPGSGKTGWLLLATGRRAQRGNSDQAAASQRRWLGKVLAPDRVTLAPQDAVHRCVSRWRPRAWIHNPAQGIAPGRVHPESGAGCCARVESSYSLYRLAWRVIAPAVDDGIHAWSVPFQLRADLGAAELAYRGWIRTRWAQAIGYEGIEPPDRLSASIAAVARPCCA